LIDVSWRDAVKLEWF